MINDKQNKKEQILQISIKLFAEKTFHNATIAEIAKSGGFSEGSIYNYFINKNDILLEIFLSFWHDLNKKIEYILSFQEDENPRKKIGIVIKILRQKLAKNEHSLYLLKVLTEALPHFYLLKKGGETEVEEKLIEKRNRVKFENKKFLELLDKLILEGQKDKKINTQLIRRALCGSYLLFLYGLFLKGTNREEDITYSIQEAEGFLNNILIPYFIKDKPTF